MLSTHLRLDLPSGLFPFGFPTKTLHTVWKYTARIAGFQVLTAVLLKIQAL